MENDKSILVVTHGMGVHTEETLKKEVLDAANIALQRYPSYKDKKFENFVEIKPISYDDIFEAERFRLIEANQPVSQYFKSAGKLPSLFIENIVNLEEKIGEDNFYTTNALDVLLYASFHCEAVRLRLISKLSDFMSNKGSASFHVLAHSLGAAAMHDTLHKAYTGGIANKEGKLIKLHPVNNKLDSLWMVANVSRLMFALNPLKVTFDPMDTLVKPATDASGCTRFFYNIHHKWDPFTKAFRFEPSLSSNWLHPDDYSDLYRYIVTEKIISSYNPHDLTGYLTDPDVSYPFLKRVMPAGTFSPTKFEVLEAHGQVIHLVDKTKKVIDYVGDISSINDLSEFLVMVKQYKSFIDSL